MKQQGQVHVERARKFGVWTLTFLVVANMIGAGVFTTSGFTIQQLPSPWQVLLAWFVAGCIALAGAVSYGQLIQAMPESGGEYVFLARAAHPLLGFIAGWVSLIAGFTGAIAFAAAGLESYLVPATARPPWLPEDAIAVFTIVLCGCLHGYRPSLGAVVQNLAVLLKLLLLTLFLVIAILQLSRFVGRESLHGAMGGWAPGAFAQSLVWISLSYLGFNAAVYVCDEAKEPNRSVPRALLLGTLGVFVLYLALNAVFVFGPPLDAIQGVPDVAAVAAQHIGGSVFALFIRLTVTSALFTSVLSMTMAAPRVYAKMADDGLLPPLLRFRGHAPAAAVALQVALAVIIVLSSTLQTLLNYLGLTLSLSAAASVACLFLPGVRNGVALLSARYLAPAFYVFATLGVAVVMAVDRPYQLIGTATTFAVGAVLYFFVSRAKA